MLYLMTDHSLHIIVLPKKFLVAMPHSKSIKHVALEIESSCFENFLSIIPYLFYCYTIVSIAAVNLSVFYWYQ